MPQPREMDVTTKRTKSTKEENVFPGLDYPIFVSFAIFVVRKFFRRTSVLAGKTCSKGKAGFFDSFLQFGPVLLGKRRALPAREALHGQTAHAHQLAKDAPPMGA
jgi:hypothetical protein